VTAGLAVAIILLLVLVSSEAMRVSSDTVHPGLHEFRERRHPAGRRWLAVRTSGAMLAILSAVLLLPVLWELLT
jgi:hypothetical protein